MSARALFSRAVLSFLLVFACPAVSAAPAPAGKQEKQLNELRDKIDSLQKRLADAEESKSEAADALKESERAISDANRALRDLAGQAKEADARLAELRGESERGQAALQRQQSLLARQLYHAYIGGQNEVLKLLLNREDPNDIARRMHYFSYVSRARADMISALRAGLARLKALAQEAEDKAQELAAITAEQQVQRQRLEREKAARSGTLLKLSREIQQQRRQIGTMKRDEQRLARLVENLARLTAREKRTTPRLRNERVPERSAGGDLFAELKGRLALPVRGDLTNRFGGARAEGGASWKGLFIAARSGEAVRAVAAGRVVFADWLRGFGNLLIIDHGGDYLSLYGNNESLYKQVGEIIHIGETIATVGNSGGNPDSGLYFELRHQGRPFDPLGWVTVK